jgi:arabinogalactan endo-1,4-beta-galactosidase
MGVRIYFILKGLFNNIEMSDIEEVAKKVNEADTAIRTVFPKADPLLVVRLVFDENEKKEHIYTLEVILEAGQNVEVVRDSCTNYWHGTRILS